MNWLLVAALATAGLVIGWCLRTVIFRLAVPAGEPGLAVPAGEPRPAACPACGRYIPVPAGRWRRPVVSLAARCPACRAHIGPRPGGPELVTAIALGALAARVHPALVLAAACWLAVCCVALAWIDAAVQRLPDVLTAPAYAGTAVLLLLAAAASGHWADLLRAIGGGLALAAAFLAFAVISRSAIGLGDAKLAASLGTMLAWAGWPTLIAGVFAGFLIGAVYGLGLLVTRRATRQQRIPFGPFMIAGAFLALLVAV